MAEDKTTLVDPQTQIEGKLTGKDAAIHGSVKGEIAITGRLLIGETGHVHATVSADAVEIAGELEGDVRARSLVLRETARVKGRVDAQALVVREGAWLSGPVSSGETAARQAPAQALALAHKPAEKPGA